MFTQFFGNYLLNHDLIEAEALKSVFKNIKNTRVRLGMVAVNEGFLTADQADQINELQKKHDKRFGDIAVEMSYLTPQQLDLILNKQKSEHMMLAQTIVDLGIMSLHEFETAIEGYKMLYDFSDETFEELKDGKIDHVIYNMLDMDDETIKAYVVLFYKNMVRFITDEVHISPSVQIISPIEIKRTFEQTLYGDQDLYTAYTAEDDTLMALAEKFSGESIYGIDEYTIDVCKEYLNLHNGLFTVNMSDEGSVLKLNIQTYKENHIPKGKTLYKIPFHTIMGDIDLIIG